MIQVFDSPRELFRAAGKKEQPFILSVGNFDGLHQGHLQIIHQLKDLKKKQSAQSLIYSFKEHPRQLLQQVSIPQIISTEDKLHLLENQEVDSFILRNFWEIFNLSWEEFWETELTFLNITDVVVGFNFRFGKNAGGHLSELKNLGKVHGFKVHVIDPLEIDGEIVSSTLIRKYILEGEFEKVTKLLGRHYKIDGIIVPGDRRGKLLGYPTANVKVTHELLPKPGIYAAHVRLQGQEHPAACYSGLCPTIKNKSHYPHIEVHIIDFDENIYNEHLDVFFHFFVREDRTFPHTEALKKQIGKDLEIISNYFGCNS